MSNGRYTKECPICGKSFSPCTTDLGMFNWRRVTCSMECGKEYFRRVLESRGQEIPPEFQVAKKSTTRKKKTVTPAE